MRGRPMKLNQKLIAKMAGEFQLGMYINTVCALNGISRECYHNWYRLGEAAKESADTTPKGKLLAEFFSAVNAASAQAEAHALSKIRQGVDNWQAQAWFLERRFKDRWARNIDKSGAADIKPGGINFVIQYPEPKDVVPEPEDEQN